MKASREIFTRYLHETGRRCTFERYAVLEQVLATPRHFTADDLHTALTAAGNAVSPATVYSTLDLLVDCGLATRHRFEHGPATSASQSTAAPPPATTLCAAAAARSPSRPTPSWPR